MLYQLSYAGAAVILGGVTWKRTAMGREENEVEFARIVAFSDGVFAIAITLLVLNLEIPHGLAGSEVADALWAERESLLAFAVSFAVIGRFWIAHHQFFGQLRAFDGRLIGLNLLYLAFVVLIPFSSDVLGEYGGESAAVVLYAVNLAVTVLAGLAMWVHAWRAGLAALDVAAHREGRRRSLYIAAVFAASIPVAFVAPTVAPLLWFALFLEPVGRLARHPPS